MASPCNVRCIVEREPLVSTGDAPYNYIEGWDSGDDLVLAGGALGLAASSVIQRAKCPPSTWLGLPAGAS